MRCAVRILTMILLGVTLAIGVAEAAVRYMMPIPEEQLLPLPYNREALRKIIAGDTYYRFDQQLGWVPGGTGNYGKVVYRANAAGFRANREYDLQPPATGRRIGAFGDSFTHCDEVDYKDCWTFKLETAWPGSEVLNFGVPGYGTDQAWLRYKRDGRQYRPCVVLIDYFVENINRVVNRFRPFYSPEDGIALSKPRFVLDGDGLRLMPNPTTNPEQLTDPAWVEHELGPNDAWYFPHVFTSTLLDVSEIERVARSAAYRSSHRDLERGDGRYPMYRTHPEAVELTTRILTEFARDTGRDGATPVVVFFPGRRDVTDAAIRQIEEPYTPIMHRLESEGVATIDLAEYVIPFVQRRGTDGLYAENGHYNQRGNELIATALAQRLPSITAHTCTG